jgi:hypothetical protein
MDALFMSSPARRAIVASAARARFHYDFAVLDDHPKLYFIASGLFAELAGLDGDALEEGLE